MRYELLTTSELSELNGGGVDVTGTIISSITRGITVVFELGRSLGSTIRRLVEGKICEL